MKLKLQLSFIVIGLFLVYPELFSQKRNLLSGKYSLDMLKESLVGADHYRPLPPCGDPAWKAIPEDERRAVINEAESYLGYNYPSLKASVYLDFVRNGNRSNYENMYFNRRKVIAYLLTGEILENDGRFMDDLINGIWLVCEETSWTVPAHVGMQKAGSGLPDKDEPVVALFSAETGSLLAAVDYFVGDKLDKVNPLIRKRIHEEVQKRILEPVLKREDFWWMGLSGRIPNNWDPWIVSNWINAALVLEKDPELRAASVHKAMVILDQFLNPYPADGGCDEGPGYWGRAGASLFDCLDQLYKATDGKIDIFGEPLIRNIGDYIYKVYIAGHWFVNFADASAKIDPDALLIYRYGKATGSENLTAFANYLNDQDQQEIRNYGTYGLMVRTLPNSFVIPDISTYTRKFDPGSTFMLPDLQVVTAREMPGSTDGLFLAAKGGNNNESHNHNDVGNFIVYLNGDPLFIDAGVGTYTAKTFSPQRYEIWTMQSSWHNLPDINGVMQKKGASYKAEDVQFTDKRYQAGMSLDMSGAWPEEAGIEKAERSLILDRKKGMIIIRDEMTFSKNQNQVDFHFLTMHKPEVKGNRLVFSNPENGIQEAEMLFPKDMKPELEVRSLEDHKLSRVWGEKIYRISLPAAIPGSHRLFEFRIVESEVRE